jgi:hypothetical protein
VAFNRIVQNPQLIYLSNRKTKAGFCGTNLIVKANREEIKPHDQALPSAISNIKQCAALEISR